jgi:glycosyltransferase involved in cell wall biosynthesis
MTSQEPPTGAAGAVSRGTLRPTARPPTFFAILGDAENPDTHSGQAYFFLRGARDAGLADAGLDLSCQGRLWTLRRAAWSLRRMLAGDRLGGFQYSAGFLERLWRPVCDRVRGAVVINCFQLFPPSLVADPSLEKWFFLDLTLKQVFDDYGFRTRIGRRIAEDALHREREGYRAAAGIMAWSRYAADSFVRDYGLPQDKVHIVVPGANVDPHAYGEWQSGAAEPTAPADDRPLRLGFIGREWHRKGLDRLLRAAAAARRAGVDCRVRVIGCPRSEVPAELAGTAGTEWVGFVSKRREPQRFLELVAGCDVGFLLSRAEAAGLSLREFHALGIPTVGTDVGGIRDMLIPGASVCLPGDASDDMIAEAVVRMRRDPEWFAGLRTAAWHRRRDALWPAAVARMREFWPHPAAEAEPVRS